MATSEKGSMEASGYGLKARFDNIDTKTLLLALLVVLCLLFVAWQWTADRTADTQIRTEYTAAHKLTQTLIGTVIANQKATIDLINEARRENRNDTNEITFVLTRTQAQREALNLEMPPSLRQKIIQQPPERRR